ncbi:unnamed protein product, partial [marine sediment metagenome]
MCFGATYYIDATNGNVSNTGLSPEYPWKTIAQVNSKSFSPGDSILFKKGETWRETLTVPSSGSADNVITFGAYGTGAKPIISGSNLIKAGWSKDSQNIWKSTVTTQPTIVYFNGERGTLVAAKANITSEFKWFWASNVLYVWAPSGITPSAYYINPGIEAGDRNQAIRTNDKSYVIVDGITARDGNENNGATVNVGSVSVTGIVFQNCVIERGAHTGIGLKGSTTAASVTIDHCTIQNNGGWGIWFDQTYTTATVSNSIITGNGWASAADDQQYGGIQGYLGNVNIYSNTIYDNVLGTANATNESHGIYTLVDIAIANIY